VSSGRREKVLEPAFSQLGLFVKILWRFLFFAVQERCVSRFL
jgi:hypothetical protein